MLYRIPNAAAAAATALVLTSLGLTGCSSGNNSTVTHTPALQLSGGRDTARSSVQATILTADLSNGIALPGGPTPASIARRMFALANGRRPSATGTSTGACINGIKQSQTTNAGGSQTTTTDYYYDAVCTTLEAEEVITVATPSTPPNTDGTGTITSYDRSGAVRVVQHLTLHVTSTLQSSTNTTSETFTMTDNAAATATGTTTSSVGATCIGAPPGSVTVNCAIAHYGTSAGVTFGEAIGVGATAATTAGGQNNANVNVAFYLASGLGIAQNGTSWGVTGAQSFNTASGTYAYSSTGSSGSGAMSLKDALYSYQETAALSSTGLTVTIIQNPNSAFNTTSQIATATVDVAGTGVLNYADGTSETIAGGLLGY
jgi:hypothetical protein